MGAWNPALSVEAWSWCQEHRESKWTPARPVCQSHLRWDIMILRRYNECALVPFSFSLNLCCWAGNWRMSHYCPRWIMRNWRRIWFWGVTAWKPSCCRLYAGYVPFSWSEKKKRPRWFSWLAPLLVSFNPSSQNLSSCCLLIPRAKIKKPASDDHCGL